MTSTIHFTVPLVGRYAVSETNNCCDLQFKHFYTVISTPYSLQVPDLIPISEVFLPMEIQPKMDASYCNM